MSNNGGQQAVNVTTHLQLYITRLENQEKELTTVRNTYNSLLKTKEAAISKLHTTVTVLEQNYTNLMHDNTVTEANYHKLKLEVEGLKQVKNLDVANESVIDTKIKELSDKMSRLEMSQNLTSMQVHATDQALSTRVGFTACDGYKVSESRIQFQTVKSSHCISMASSYPDGKFIAPKEGCYLVLSNILTKRHIGNYIRKNGNEIARAWFHVTDSNITPYYSAPLSAFIELSVNGVITIEGASLNPSSCLTIVQL
ncbi:unnamed protein product [Mytilus coruscus]|uniref:C1q domain-containing protein n=1 Tax=Mytilus coruscus TaxID=42192 RepID=A0A6J8ADN8_MYTCO|nr:unnamed protein product [Mytilus coruscus]